MKIGIIGGGQLGMMMASCAKELGHTIYSLDPSPECSITKYSDKHFICNFDDKLCLNNLCKEVDVVTYEFENIDYDTLVELEKSYNIKPSSKALLFTQNRFVEKTYVNELGINTVDFKKIHNSQQLTKYENKGKFILKTLCGGYDGKGQIMLDNIVCENARKLVNRYPCIIEKFVDFDYEISIIVTRLNSYELEFFPICLNEHRSGILFTSTATNNISKTIENKAREYASTIAQDLEIVGTLAVEFFVKDEELIFNEMAPRPHNSGHYTIEGCNVSQFENHILAITNSKIIKPILNNKCLMVNVIGDDIKRDFSKYEGVFHDYYKNEIKPGRKMGHITFVANNIDELNEKSEKYLEELQ